MAELLALTDRDDKPAWPGHQAALCLQCHAVPNIHPASAVAEGVGCAGCHGPSDKWVAEHYLPSWKALPNREKWERFGFIPTKNLVARSLNCASCHVGD